MIQTIKNLLKNRKKEFQQICQTAGLTLDFEENKNTLDVFKDIFIQREYADCFPFYEKAIVVDIGAHYGYFSLFASKNLNPQSQLFAVEPSPANFDQLNRNLKNSNITNTKTFQQAIGGENTTMELFEAASVNFSIVKNYALSTDKKQGTSVTVQTLETFMVEQNIPHIDFLKLDCEGAEYAIFEQTPSTVFQKIKTISMEFHDLRTFESRPQVLVEKLRSAGFEIVKYQFERTSMNLNYGKIIGTRV